MSGSVPALEKGLQVIESILSANETLSMSQIAEALGYKVSELQRTIEYLNTEGYLKRGLSGAYAPGPKAYGLADKCRDTSLVARAEGPMRRFALRCNASIHLGVLVDRMLHVVFGVEGGGMVRVSVKPGLYDAADSVSGRLLLAYDDHAPSDSEHYALLRERGWNSGEAACAHGVNILAVTLSKGQNPCAAVLASPYLCQTTVSCEPREDLFEGLLSTAREIESFF